MYNRDRGNTLAEYFLFGGAVLAIAFAALQVLGINLSNLLAGTSGQLNNPYSLFSLLKPASPGNVQSNPTVPAMNPSVPPSNSTLPVPTGTVVSNPTAAPVLVSGSNGDLEKIYGNIETLYSIAQKYEESEPDLYTLLAELHKLARNGSNGAPYEGLTIEQMTLVQSRLANLTGVISEIENSPLLARLTPADRDAVETLLTDARVEAGYFLDKK